MFYFVRKCGYINVLSLKICTIKKKVLILHTFYVTLSPRVRHKRLKKNICIYFNTQENTFC